MTAATGTATWTQQGFTASDGYHWHYRRYPAAGTPRAEVVPFDRIPGR